MKTATYQTLDGQERTVTYDPAAPIRIHWAPKASELGSKTACGLLVRDVLETRDFITNVASTVECDECEKAL